jgi:heme/copper-type cytochrome/quinol oxidase subunit 3
MLLFILLTMMTFGGPMAIVLVGRGGDRPGWPPDRPVEWWTFGIVTIGFLLLMGSCILDASLTLRQSRRHSTRTNPPASKPAPTDSTNDRPEVQS